MANSSNKSVWELIQSLNPTEKKAFTLYTKSIGEEQSATYKLYLEYLKMKTFDANLEQAKALKCGIKNLSHAKDALWDRISRSLMESNKNPFLLPIKESLQMMAVLDKTQLPNK